MDIELAIVSSMQLREMLQQQSPHSSQVQELAEECQRLVATGEEVLRKRGPDARVEKACKELEESLNFFRSILSADEDLEQQQRGEGDWQQQHTAASAVSRRSGRDGSETGKKQQHASSSRRRRKKDKSGAAAAGPEATKQDTLQTLFSDWPETDFAFERDTEPTAAAFVAHHSNSPWVTCHTDDPFDTSAAAGPAASASADSTARRIQNRASSRNRAGGKGGSSGSRHAAADPSSSDGIGNESDSSSASTRSRDSRESKTNEIRHRPWREKSRAHRRRAASEGAAGSSNQAGATAADAAAGCCCYISVASLQAFLQLSSSSSTALRLSIELSFPSYKVETIEEGASSGVLSSFMNSTAGQEVVWPQRVSFFIRPKRSSKKKKNRDNDSAGEALQALQKEGQMRFLVGSPDGERPSFVGDFSLDSITSGETMFHRVALHSACQRGIPSSGPECGFLSFSILVEAGKAAARAAEKVVSASDRFSPQQSARVKPQKREAGKGEARDPHLHHSRNLGFGGEWTANEVNRSTRSESAQENHTLQQQNKILQTHIQQQQQALLQHQQQLQTFHAQIQQMNVQITDAYQRVAAYEAQHQQQLNMLRQLQQERDAVTAAAEAEKANLQKLVHKLEIELEAAKEATEQQQQQARRYRRDSERLEREVQDQKEHLRVANSKAKEQEAAIAELTTLLDNARSRIRNERQRTEELLNKLEDAVKAESMLKAKLQKSQEEAAERNRQLLSLTWGLESPPVFAGLPDSPLESQRQQEQQDRQRQQNEPGYSLVARDGDPRLHSFSDSEGGQKEKTWISKWRPALNTSSLTAAPPAWSDPGVLRRVIPPTQPANAGWEASLLLAMQHGYSALMHADAGFFKEPLEGILLDSGFLKVEWRSSIRLGGGTSNPREPPTHLSGRVATTALFAVSVTSKLSAMPVISVALEQEVFEGGRVALIGPPAQQPKGCHVSGQLEVSRPFRDAPVLLINVLTSDSLTRTLRLKLPLSAAALCRPLVLCEKDFAAEWRSLEMQEDAVLLDLPPSHLRSAFSLLALGGRFAVLPLAEAAQANSLTSGGPGVMCIHASAAFPIINDEDKAVEDGGISCLVYLAVKRNATLENAQQTHAGPYRNRQPSGLLRVRCRSTALRCSTLEALLQQLMTPQQLLAAAAATLAPKRGP